MSAWEEDIEKRVVELEQKQKSIFKRAMACTPWDNFKQYTKKLAELEHLRKAKDNVFTQACERILNLESVLTELYKKVKINEDALKEALKQIETNWKSSSPTELLNVIDFSCDFPLLLRLGGEKVLRDFTLEEYSRMSQADKDAFDEMGGKIKPDSTPPRYVQDFKKNLKEYHEQEEQSGEDLYYLECPECKSITDKRLWKKGNDLHWTDAFGTKICPNCNKSCGEDLILVKYPILLSRDEFNRIDGCFTCRFASQTYNHEELEIYEEIKKLREGNKQ